jgi:hypothetical protein
MNVNVKEFLDSIGAMAEMQRANYVALKKQGFTSEQAISLTQSLISAVVSAAMMGQMNGNSYE